MNFIFCYVILKKYQVSVYLHEIIPNNTRKIVGRGRINGITVEMYIFSVFLANGWPDSEYFQLKTNPRSMGFLPKILAQLV